MRTVVRKTAIGAGVVVLAAAVWFGVVYGFVCELARTVE